MSVLVEGITVVFRNDSADARVAGGWEAVRQNAPNNTFRTDGRVSAVSFMVPDDVDHFIISLENVGFKFVESGSSIDIAVVDQRTGFTTVCDWLETDVDHRGVRYCWSAGSTPGEMAVFKNWNFKSSLYSSNSSFIPNDALSNALDFIETRDNLNVYRDKKTGEERFVGRPFHDKDDFSTNRLKEILFKHLTKVVYDSMVSDGWMSLIVYPNQRSSHHLVMRYANQIGVVFIEAGFNEDPLTSFNGAERKQLIELAISMKAIPILVSIDINGKPDQPIRSVSDVRLCQSISLELRRNYLLHDLKKNMEWSERYYDLEAEIELSDWELHDFGIQVVRGVLEQEGQTIESWDSKLGAGSQIIANIDDERTYILVRAVCYPEIEAMFDVESLRGIAQLAARSGAQAKTASVSFASKEDPFLVGEGIPIYRGKAVSPRFTGLKDISIPFDG